MYYAVNQIYLRAILPVIKQKEGSSYVFLQQVLCELGFLKHEAQAY